MRSHRRLARAVAALAGLVLAVLLAGCSAGGQEPAFSGRVLDNPFQAPDVQLTDTEGDPYSLAGSTDQPLTLVFFGYTNCPDVCPLVMNTITAAMNRLDDADRDDVDVVLVTTDPRRDTEQVLRQYLDDYDTSFIGLTGSLDDIIATGDPLATYVSEGEKIPATGGYDLGGHSTNIIAIDADDEATVFWSQDTSAGQLAADVHTLLTDPPTA